MENKDLIREFNNLSAQELAEKCKENSLSVIIENGEVTGIKHE